MLDGYSFEKNIDDLKALQIIIKAASSDGRDLAPGSPPTGGFRMTGNGEQYAFKKVNIEEYVKVIYMYQTCCQLVALCP